MRKVIITSAGWSPNMSESKEAAASALRQPQQRSPKYPYIGLDLALERTKAIHSKIREHAQPREVVAQAYGKPVTSSATMQTFSTLLQYGLLENVSGDGGRRMRVSDLAQTILHPHAPQERVQAATQKAALSPPIFKELWEKFGDTREVSEKIPLYYLTADREREHGSTFTERAANEVLRVYQATLEFAGVSDSDSGEEAAAGCSDSAPEGGQDRGGMQKPPPQPDPDTGGGQRAPERYKMAEGERELQTGLLSKSGATYRVIVSGRVGEKEIERLIARLELDKEMLADDEPTNATEH